MIQQQNKSTNNKKLGLLGKMGSILENLKFRQLLYGNGSYIYITNFAVQEHYPWRYIQSAQPTEMWQ